MKLGVGLSAVTTLGVDTAPLIYLVEENPQYLGLVRAIFRRVDIGEMIGVTSVITLAEVLVHPLRIGNVPMHHEYRDILLNGSIRTVGIDVPTTERAAQLRAPYGIMLPDALQLAVAIGERCEAFLTNDRRLARVTELRVLVLDDLEL